MPQNINVNSRTSLSWTKDAHHLCHSASSALIFSWASRVEFSWHQYRVTLLIPVIRDSRINLSFLLQGWVSLEVRVEDDFWRGRQTQKQTTGPYPHPYCLIWPSGDVDHPAEQLLQRHAPPAQSFVVNIAITSVIEHFSSHHVLALFAAHAIFTSPGVKNWRTNLLGIRHLGLHWRDSKSFFENLIRLSL